jgi:hypothetical protein
MAAGNFEFRLFEAMCCENSYFLVVELHGLFSESVACPAPAMKQLGDRSSINLRSAFEIAIKSRLSSSQGCTSTATEYFAYV